MEEGSGMRKISASVIGIIVIVAIFLAGEAYAYLPSDRGFSSDVTVTDDSIQYSIGAEGAYVGSVVLIDNGDLHPVSELYIYRDATYQSDVYEKNITATGSQVFTQDYVIDQLTKNLNFRGITDIKMVNAEELKEQLQSDLDSAPITKKGLVIISGAIPETVFGPSTILEDWIDNGGFLYWAGSDIGRNSSTPDDINYVGKQIAMIGTDSFEGSNKNATIDTEHRSEFSFENQWLSHAPDVNAIRDSGRQVLATGFTDGDSLYSVVFVEKGNGQIVMFSSGFSSPQIHDMAISIASGLTYKSQIIDFKESEFNRNLSDDLEKPTVHGNLSVYISVGKYHCAYAERYDLS